MRDFFYTKKFKILLAVAVVLAGMMAWAGANGRLTNAPQEIMGALLTPFQKAAQLLGGGVDGLLDPKDIREHTEYDTQSLAKFAFSLFWRALNFAEEHQVPILLDY